MPIDVVDVPVHTGLYEADRHDRVALLVGGEMLALHQLTPVEQAA
jgi:hypothetical protein